YHQTNQKTNTGKTLKPWPILVDHYNIKSEQLPMALHIKLKGKQTCVIEPLLNTMDKNKNLCR
ncbi:hypothetical protein AB7W14_08475, partial [Providencia rettgeri]